MGTEMKKFTATVGNPTYKGAVWTKDGVYFSMTAEEGKKASLLLYKMGEEKIFQELPFPREGKTGTVAAMFVADLDPARFEYNFCVGNEIVPDPYARRVMGGERFGSLADEKSPHKVRCRIVKNDYHAGDEPGIPYEDTVIYKLHVRGFSMGSKSKVRKKGTFAGVCEKIPYLKELGVNVVELMPAYEFAELVKLQTADMRYMHLTEETVRLNYWGYQKGSYFAPKASYCATGDPAAEFARMVQTLHENGLECLMEFYFPKETAPEYVLDVLHYWKLQYRVDGFHLIGEGVPFAMLAHDALLSNSKLIFIGAETSGIYGGRAPKVKKLGEHNMAFQNVMRRFLKGDEGVLEEAAYRARRNPAECGVINYMADNDGFTMADMVSYENKHNEENHEENRDGSCMNFSWNCGVEGPVRKPSIKKLRMQQLKNAWLLLLLSQGTPLIYQGDEMGNTQGGNNNAYCQDNETGWVDWNLNKQNTGLLSFVRTAIQFRKEHTVLHGKSEPRISDYRSQGFPDLSYHSQKAWFGGFEYNQRSLGILYNGAYGQNIEESLYIACNMHWDTQEFAIPALPGGQKWYFAVDTAREESFFEPELLEESKQIRVPARSIVILIGKQV